MMRFKTKVIGTIAALLVFFTPPPAVQAKANVEDIRHVTTIVETAKHYVGSHYCHGGNSPTCFDCSGFTQYVYKENGVLLPRVANDQYKKVKHIPRSEARPGDLVFFMSGNYAYHVGIYVGNGKVLHAPKHRSRVRVDKIWTTNVRFGRA